MTTRKSNDYKITAVNYYLVEDKTQEEVCKIFKCNPRSLMRWVERYKKDGNVDIHYRKPIAYKVKKEYVDYLLQEIINIIKPLGYKNYYKNLKINIKVLI
jgi:transposase-like protein